MSMWPVVVLIALVIVLQEAWVMLRAKSVPIKHFEAEREKARAKSALKPQHVPLLFRPNGLSISGLKCCENCGLSETFWEKFPGCSE